MDARPTAPAGTVQFEAMWAPWFRGLFSVAEGPGLLNHTDCAVMQPESSARHTELPSIPSADDPKAVLT